VHQVAVIPNDLARWDHARPGDLLFVPIWSDLRPLRGAAGLLDWRMCGRLSSWLMGGELTGADGEQMLFPSGNRLVWRLVLAAGAGARADLSENGVRLLLRRMLKTLRGLKVGKIALALPDGDAGAAGPSVRRALDLALAEIEAQPGALAELTVIVPPAAQKELTDVLRRRGMRS